MSSITGKKWFRLLWVLIFGASCFTLGYVLKPKASSTGRAEMLRRMQGQTMRAPMRAAPVRRMERQ